MKSTKYNLFSNLQNGSASSKGKRFNLQSKYHDTAILTCLWYITKICFRTVHGRNIIFFSVLRIEDMFEVHIVNSNILTSKNLFLFFEMARVKLTVWFLVPLSVLRLRAERLGFFLSRWRARREERICFRCHNLGMMVRKSGTFLDMNKCINRPLKLKRFRDQKWNNFAYILNGVMLKLVSKERM